PVYVMTGLVLSILMPLTVTLVELPALSVAVPVAESDVPFVLRVIGDVQLAMPDPTSAHVKVTTTSVLFQPAALATGNRAPVIVGGVVSSIVTVCVALFALPAPSVTV